MDLCLKQSDGRSAVEHGGASGNDARSAITEGTFKMVVDRKGRAREQQELLCDLNSRGDSPRARGQR